jgi:cytidine deaminase
MKTIHHEKLLKAARDARELAYAPYSNYLVGAALLGASGKIYTGCNVENASYGLANCAERTAVFKAVSEGEREFVALAVVTLNGGSPCGACRQVLFEFMEPGSPVWLADAEFKDVRATTVGALLPDGFNRSKLPQARRRKRDLKTTKP